MNLCVDLNCDMGERYGAGCIGSDELLMPLVTSANIACGYHGGDPMVMHQTVLLAQKNGVAIGAHPSYPDLQGFGRRQMQLSAQEVYDTVLYQIGALEAFTRASGGKLHHVKPHGALYNHAAKDEETAASIVHAVFYFDRSLMVYGPPSSMLEKACVKLGMQFCAEVFADRSYQSDGSLTPRHLPGALIKDVVKSVHQVMQILETKTVTALDGTIIPMHADTICIHGDGQHAVEFTTALRESITEKGIRLQLPQHTHA